MLLVVENFAVTKVIRLYTVDWAYVSSYENSIV